VTRDELIQAGIENGRRHRRERGLSETIENPEVLSDLADLLSPVPTRKPEPAR
jgi:hypothetical protein